MAAGVNHAKQLVLDQANCLVEKLQNGNSQCPETQGRALGLVLKMITPMFEAEFVTVQDCKKTHEKNLSKGNKVTRIKVGPVEIEGAITTTLLLHGTNFLFGAGLIFMIGKVQNWW